MSAEPSIHPFCRRRRAPLCPGLFALFGLALPWWGPRAPLRLPPPTRAASADGGTVFFTTNQKLVPGDTDNRLDVYERSFDGRSEPT